MTPRLLAVADVRAWSTSGIIGIDDALLMKLVEARKAEDYVEFTKILTDLVDELV